MEVKKEYANSTGVYQIKNIINKRLYIGSTAKGFKYRLGKHIYELKKNNHGNRHLQNSFRKYGIENFEFEIISFCPPNLCLKQEQWFIDNVKPFFNICLKVNSRLGVKASEETLQKQRARVVSDYTKKILSETHKGVSAVWNKGRVHTDEQRRLNSEKHKGKTAWNKGIPCKESSKQKMVKKKCKFIYKIKTPNGSIVETNSMNQFARDNNIPLGGIGSFAATLRGVYRGCSSVQYKGYQIISKIPINSKTE